jgi:epoxyqueuosine reductase
VAAKTGAGHDLVAPLVRLAAQAAPMVRGHAVWAVQRIASADAPQLLAVARASETHPVVRAEHAADADGAT